MKRWVVLLVLLLAFASTGAQTPVPPVGPEITWEESTFDFGEVLQGDRLEHTFKFTNTGSAPLLITNVEVSCGCTTPKGWPRDPINPGSRGEITVGFNSAGKNGKQMKVITVVSNSAGINNKVSFTATVIPKLPN